MFVLSIIPIHLSLDSDGVAANLSNNIDAAEHKIMELEAALSSEILNQYLGVELQEVTTKDIYTLEQQLAQARQEELGLIQQTWGTSNNDSQARLESVLRMQKNVEQRLQDLDNLTKALQTGTRLNYIVSGVDNTTLLAAQNEIEMTLKYKALLSESEKFWQEVNSTKRVAQEVQDVSKFWDSIVSSTLQQQQLNTVYSFRNNIISSQPSVDNLSSSATSMNEIISNFYQMSKDEVGLKLAKTNEVLQKVQSISTAFSGSLDPNQIANQIAEIEGLITSEGTLLNELGIQGNLQSIISMWKDVINTENQNVEIMSNGNEFITGGLTNTSNTLDQSLFALIQDKENTIDNPDTQETNITNQILETKKLQDAFMQTANDFTINTNNQDISANKILFEELQKSITNWALIVNNATLKESLNLLINNSREILQAQEDSQNLLALKKSTLNNNITNTSNGLNESYQNMTLQKDSTVATTLWNSLIQTQNDPAASDFWNKMYTSAEAAQQTQLVSKEWNTLITNGNETQMLESDSSKFQELIQLLKDPKGNLSSGEAGNQLISSLDFLKNLQTASSTWQNNALSKIASTVQTKVEAKPLNLEEKYDPTLLTNVAKAKRLVSGLKSLIGALSQNDSLNQIVFKIEELQSKLEDEINRARQENSSISDKAVSGIRTQIKSLLNEKMTAEILSAVQSSLRSSLQSQISQLNNNLNMSAILSSG